MMKTKEVQLRQNKEFLKCSDEIERYNCRSDEMHKNLKTIQRDALRRHEQIAVMQRTTRTGVISLTSMDELYLSDGSCVNMVTLLS